MHGRRLALALLLAASSALTAGCRSAAGPTTPKTVADITSASSTAAVQTLLDHRAIALLGHDRSAFDATLNPHDTAFRRVEDTLYANLAQIPLGTIQYSLSGSASSASFAKGVPHLRADVVEYAVVRPVSHLPMATHVDMTFINTDGRWYVAAEGEPSQLKNRTYSRPWFGKPVSVAVTARTIAVVDRGSPVSARSLASQTSDAIVADQEVLGLKHMTPPVLVDATTSGSVYNWAHHEVGALFVPSGSAWPGADNNSYVIKANPTYVIQLLRDRETLRHEITHLLLAYIGPSLPTWVSEGIAEYVGAYPGELTYPEANAGRAVLLAQPRALPRSDEWGDSPTYDYSVAHMSVLWLIERSGMRKFTQFLDEYQQVYTDQADNKTPELLKQYFGVSVNQVVTGAFREFTRVPQP